MRLLALLLGLAACAGAAVPTFTHAVVANSQVSNIASTRRTCGVTANDTDTIEWEVYNKETEQYATAVVQQCVTIPPDLGITTEAQLGESKSFAYRPCASNAEGRVCADASHYTIVDEAKREMLTEKRK